MKKTPVFVFGNIILKQDAQAIRLLPDLWARYKDFEFIHADPTDSWWEGSKRPIIIDTVAGLHIVKQFSSIDSFEEPKARITPHDYDLFMDLGFLLKLKKISSFIIIGIPEKGAKNHILKEIGSILKSIPVESSV